MDNIILITPESELESAKTLGFPSLSYFGGKKVEDYDNSIIINWGFGSGWYNRQNKIVGFKNSINNYKSIQKNVNKPESLKIISKTVNTPKMWLAGETIPKNKVVVYRYVQHSAGRGFNVIKTTNRLKVQSGYYATEFIKTNIEHRVFFCGNKTMLCTRTTRNKEFLNQKHHCRSLWCYNFYKRIPEKLHNQVLKAKKALRLDVGAFDILKKGNKYYFLECNTAVTCDHNVIQNFFRKNLIYLAKTKFKKFNFKNYEKMAEYPNAMKVEF